MPEDNKISASISAEDKALILQKFAEIRALLPFLANLNLTPEEKQELPKIGDKTLAFDQKCAAYMTARPELIPSYVNPVELAKDRKLMNDLADLIRESKMLHESMVDGLALCGSDAFMGDTSFYQNIRQAAKRGVPGTDSIYEDLRKRFPGRPRGGDSSPSPS